MVSEIKTPLSLKQFFIFFIRLLTSLICAKTLVAVINWALPNFLTMFVATFLS